MVTAGNHDGFSVLVDERAEAILLILSGELDLSTVPGVRERCMELAQRSHPRDVVIDTTGITFIDATGLRSLIEGQSTIRQSGTSVSVVPSRQVQRLLDLLGLEELFVTHPTIETAIRPRGSEAKEEGGTLNGPVPDQS